MGMYLTVRVENGSLDFEIHMPFPKKDIVKELASSVIAIQANGDEAAYLREQYPALTPMIDSTVYLYGDLARTVALNLGIATY